MYDGRKCKKGIGMNELLLMSSISRERIIIAPSGRKFYRHESNKGSLMMYTEDSVSKKMIIPDAQFRLNKAWMTVAASTPLKKYANIPKISFRGRLWTPQTAQTITDAQIDEHFSVNKDTNTAKQNTDVLVGIATCEAALYCRTVKIAGIACDLPNIQQLARIYCDAVTIDSLDPTVDDYSSFRLLAWRFNSGGYAWSSTDFASTSAWTMYLDGRCQTDAKTNARGVIPILEI